MFQEKNVACLISLQELLGMFAERCSHEKKPYAVCGPAKRQCCNESYIIGSG